MTSFNYTIQIFWREIHESMMIHTIDPKMNFFVFWESPWLSKYLFMYVFMYMQNKPIPLENCHILM